jgi:hypothetical protein
MDGCDRENVEESTENEIESTEIETRTPGEWVYGPAGIEGEDEDGEEGEEDLVQEELLEVDAGGVDQILKSLDLDYNSCQLAGRGGSKSNIGEVSATIRSPIVAAALANRPDLRAKLENLKRLKASWASGEQVIEGGGCTQVVEEDDYPSDYATLQMADSVALANARMSLLPSDPAKTNQSEEEWTDFTLAGLPSLAPREVLEISGVLPSDFEFEPNTSAVLPPPLIPPVVLKPELKGLVPGKFRAVSPMSEQNKAQIKEAMSKFQFSPKPNPYLDRYVQQALEAAKQAQSPAKR